MKELIQFADAISSIGILVISQEEHTVLFFNQKVKEQCHEIEAGDKCYDRLGESCAFCPIKSIDQPSSLVISYIESWNGYVELTADEYVWEGTPAYLITIIPQMQSRDMKESIAYNRMVECAASVLCEEIAYVNLTANKYVHYEREARIGLKRRKISPLDEYVKGYVKTIHPSDRKEFLQRFDMATLKQEFRGVCHEVYGEFRQKESDGNYRWKSFRAMPVDNPFDDDVLYVFLSRNIHVRKQLELQLAKRLDVAYQAIPGGVVVLRMDEKLTIVEASESFYDVLELTDETTKETIQYLDYVDPRDRQYVQQQILHNIENDQALDVVYREKIHGQIRWIQSRGNRIKREDGYDIYLMIRMDVSQLKEAQHKLVEEQKQYREYTEGIINTLSNLVEFRDTDSGEHIKRTRSLTKILLREMGRRHPEMGMTDATISKIAGAAVLHDVGKIAVSDMILNKPGKLSTEEFELMKEHTMKGYQILKALDLKQDAEQMQYSLDISRYHHERWDGKGYPDHLKGNEIPLWSQVVSVVDVYDALVSQRVYKKAYSHEKAIQMILDGECGQFNPELIDCLVSCKDLLKKEYTEAEKEKSAS